jgi:trans-2,3-dihydro-3-hydroxyanthranilate isomerase
MDAEIWDVFAESPFGGNPLAVVHDAGALDDAAMAALAREFGFSETVFVHDGPAGRPRLRIFTPAQELPMAGHPTIGAAFALERRGRFGGERGAVELGVGPIELAFERAPGGRLSRVWMDQGRPGRMTRVDANARAGVAAAFGLSEHDLDPDAPVEGWSCGTPFLIVPLRDLDALGRARLTLDALAPWTDPSHRAALCVVVGDDGDTRCRMFGEALGVVEDPGTGSAHGPLGGWLAAQGRIAPGPDGSARFASLQGVEMGRPSRLHVRVDWSDGEHATPRAHVGGAARPVLSGALAPELVAELTAEPSADQP